MALSKIQAESMNLADTFAFTGTVSGASLAGTGAFAARFASPGTWQTISNGNILPFNNASNDDSFDTDTLFNTSTYKYTAPATGVYLFWYSIYTAEQDTGNEFGFFKNNADLDYSQGSDNKFTAMHSTDNDHMQTVSIVVPLTNGDTMAVVACADSDYYPPHSSWGGCRLK